MNTQEKLVMTRNDGRLVLGGVLVLIGLAFLLQNLGAFSFFGLIPEGLWTIFWIGAFGGAGLLFLAGLWWRRENWWMAIPGFTFLGLSGTIFVEEILSGFAFGGSIFLGSLGLGFAVVYAMDRARWWAIIPGGVLSTLALVAGWDAVAGGESGGLFFLGLALTFALVALAPNARGRMAWAWIPAGVLTVIAIMTTNLLGGLVNLLWPLALVLLGSGLLLRNYLRSNID